MYQFQQWGNLQEKKLTDKQVDELIKRSEVTVTFVLHDDSKTEKEREQERKDLELIQGCEGHMEEKFTSSKFRQ